MMNLFLLCIALVLASDIHAAPRQPVRSSNNLSDKVDDIQTEVENHTTEIRIIEEKLNNQLLIMESIRDQLQETNKSQKDLVKNNSVSLENRILALESSLKSISTDLRQIQTHANETANALKQYKQKISEQGETIDTIQKAMKNLMEAMQVNVTASTKSYTVQSGDTLEKIAKRNKTTVREITSLNGLQNEKIFIGQTLKLP
jgi:LysM repeat protein